MSENNRALTLLGLAKRARRLEAGEQPALRAIEQGRAKLVVLASDASENTGRRFRTRAGRAGVRVITLTATKTSFGGALGVTALSVAAVCDAGFTEKLLETLDGGGIL